MNRWAKPDKWYCEACRERADTKLGAHPFCDTHFDEAFLARMLAIQEAWEPAPEPIKQPVPRTALRRTPKPKLQGELF